MRAEGYPRRVTKSWGWQPVRTRPSGPWRPVNYFLPDVSGQVPQFDRLAQVPAVEVGAVDEQLVVPEEPACRTVPGRQLGVGQAAVEPAPLLPGQGGGLRRHRVETPLTDDQGEQL